MYHFTPVLGITFVSTISFYPILANLGHFGVFLAILRYPGLPSIEIHIDLTFYTYFTSQNTATDQSRLISLLPVGVELASKLLANLLAKKCNFFAS